MNPETIHNFMIYFGSILGSDIITRKLTRLFFFYSNRKLNQKIFGINFSNPAGLAAGFDKDAHLMKILPEAGFGFEEIGSITGNPCKGNPKPRLWGLKKTRSLVVNYGLKNKGAVAISKKLENRKFKIPIGISIAKTNDKKTISIESGIKDYIKAYKILKDKGDYITINISCPNAFGGRPFTNPGRLKRLLTEIKKVKKTRPIFLKLSPDITKKETDSIIRLAMNHEIDGLVCTNLSKKK